ncbi:MAG: Ig-like domain-containing protein [Caldimonas sp.]
MEPISKPRCAASRLANDALACLLLAATMVVTACGGGGTPDATDPVDPPAGVAGFQLMPARLSLVESDERLVIAIGASGALLWSSSDPAVATVDASGRVQALAKGSAVISATAGTTVARAPVTVYRTIGVAPDPSTSALIDSAEAEGRIGAEEALSYRVFALFGDARLPAAFAGAPSELPDHLLLRELSGRLPTLSPAAREALTPFLIPPVYAQSWYAQEAASVGATPATGKKRRADVTVNCFFAQPQLGATVRSTAHFNIHTVFSDDMLQGDDDKPTTETVSDFIVSVVEEVYQSETQLFKRFPLPDTKENCNGGDGAFDIYLHPLASRTKAVTVAYPGRCESVPAFMILNTNELFLSMKLAKASQPLASKKKEWKSYIAHEFLHALQFGMDRSAACADYKWLDEATATWVMDHVEPGANFEDGGTGVATPGFARRQGRFFANYLYNDHRVSIENASPESNPELNGYGDYLFFQYLARTYQPETIKAILDATEGRGSVEAMASALDAKGGMKAIWPEFARTLWNDDVNKVLDDWSRLDNYDFGLAAIYSPSTQATLTTASTKLKTMEIDQKGRPRQSFKLLDNALSKSGAFYEIQPRSFHYEHLKFSDATVSSLYFFNPVAALPNREFMKVQVKLKVGGSWRDFEDWTGEPYKQLCRDKKDERVEELILIVSNSEVNRGGEVPFRYPSLVPMLASTSNVGCWKWQGAASTVVTGTIPGPSTSTGRGDATFELASALPGRLVFEPFEGNVGGDSTSTLGECTFTSVGAGRAARRLPLSDGTIDVNLDLDTGFGQIGGEAPDRKMLQLTGSAILSSTNTVACPAYTQTSVFDTSWDWLKVDDPALYQVSTDGRSIEGRYTRSLGGGVSIDTLWKFTALRE